jgi:tryptophan-rich sensory protein
MPKINVSISLYRPSLVVGYLAVAAVGTLYVAIQLMEREVGSAIASLLVLNALAMSLLALFWKIYGLSVGLKVVMAIHGLILTPLLWIGLQVMLYSLGIIDISFGPG